MLYSTAQVGIHIAGPNQEGTTGHSAFLDLALRRDILDMLAQLMGENIILWGAQGFIKPAGAPPLPACIELAPLRCKDPQLLIKHIRKSCNVVVHYICKFAEWHPMVWLSRRR